MLYRVLVTFVFAFGVMSSFAQMGSISGTITDAKTGEAIIGANIIISGTSVGAASDINGQYQIENLKPGTYSLSISFITFKTHQIPDLLVESGKKTAVSVALQEDATELKEVVITGTREINNDVSLLTAIRESKLVVSGISAEQIVKLPDNDAAQIMKRVPGITIVDNRFVVVRGVPERYNQVMINRAIAPSTEIDKRSFSFDLIPGGAVDQLLIFKSGSADLPGDFAGGVIQVMTKQTTESEYFSVGLNVGFRPNTTFKNFSESNTSSTDLFGFDNGTRSLPDDFPTTSELTNTGITSDVRAAAGKSLSNEFDYRSYNAPVDYGLNLGFSRNLLFGNVEATTLTSLNWSTSYQHYEASFNRYVDFDTNPETPSAKQNDFMDAYNNHESKINLIHNWSFKFNNRNRIEFKNTFVQIGENNTILRSGHDNSQQSGLFNNNAYHYLSRSIYSGQLQGTYSTKNNLTKIEWMAGYNYINRNEPDYRRFRRIYREDQAAFQMILPPGSSIFDAGRFYSELTDHGFSHGVNVERKIGNSTEKNIPTIKAGYLFDYKQRDFNARYVSYLFPSVGGFDGQYGEQLSFLPIDQIFSPENMFSRNGDEVTQGFAVQEGTRSTDWYKGKTLVSAGYVIGTLPIKKFNLTAGLRVENFNQTLTTYQGDSTKTVTSLLPSANFAYNITDRSLFRLAYSKTVNRPEFREIAPFLYYQFEYNLNIQGNPSLKTATIDNIDLRWEMYPNPGEFVSLGTFYKKFINPIEFIQENASGNLQFGYKNAPEAYSYGIEAEVRKSLASLGVSKILRNLSVNLNASLIKSEVDMGEGVTFQERRREMQGQSPYVLNAGVYYRSQKEFSINVAYNILGNRIFSVGSVIYPSWIERPRNAVDLQIAKTVGAMEFKLNVQNLLNSPYRLYQDNDENAKIDESIDDPIQVYKTSQLINLSWSYKFHKN
jgi:TonB-dependent receptor